MYVKVQGQVADDGRTTLLLRAVLGPQGPGVIGGIHRTAWLHVLQPVQQGFKRSRLKSQEYLRKTVIGSHQTRSRRACGAFL